MPRPNVQPLGYCDFSGDAPAPYGYIPFADGESVDDIASALARQLADIHDVSFDFMRAIEARDHRSDGQLDAIDMARYRETIGRLRRRMHELKRCFVEGEPATGPATTEITDRLYTPVEEMPRR